MRRVRGGARIWHVSVRCGCVVLVLGSTVNLFATVLKRFFKLHFNRIRNELEELSMPFACLS